MTNHYTNTRMNASPHANYGRNAMYTNRQTASWSGGNIPSTYTGNASAANKNVAEKGFFPSGYVYSNQKSSNPTEHFYGNMPHSGQTVGDGKQMNANSGRSGPGRPSNYNGMMSAAARQGASAMGGRGGFGRSVGMQNPTASPPSGGLLGGIGGMVKGFLGKDPLGSIGKVVNIMKILG